MFIENLKFLLMRIFIYFIIHLPFLELPILSIIPLSFKDFTIPRVVLLDLFILLLNSLVLILGLLLISLIIIFTTSIVVPIEIAPYITMTYNTRNTHDQLQNRGFNKIIGSQVDKYDEDFSMTYTIIERYSDIDPDDTYAKEIFSDNLDDYVNHDYKDDTNKKYGFKFFDWNNINIKYFNEEVFDKEDHGTLSEEEIADIKAWHKTQPSSLVEYEEMIKELSDIEGKTDNEQFNYKIALGVTYKAEICYYDSERASQTNN